MDQQARPGESGTVESPCYLGYLDPAVPRDGSRYRKAEVRRLPRTAGPMQCPAWPVRRVPEVLGA